VYQAGLLRSLQVVEQSTTGAHQKRLKAAINRFEEWLGSTFEFHGHDLANCTPEDVLSYFGSGWEEARKLHGSSVSPDACAREVSLIRVYFDVQGRVGPYMAHTRSGNPAITPAISRLCRGHKRLAAGAGVRSRCAVPMTEATLHQVVRYLDGVTTAPGHYYQGLTLERDVCMFLFCWEGAMRGINSSRLRWSDWFTDADGPNVPLFGFLSHGPAAMGTMCLRAAGVKSFQGERAPGIEFRHVDSPINFMHRLHAYMVKLYATGYSLHHGVLFPNFNGLPATWTSLASTRLGHVIKNRLTEAGCYHGETCHSFRRGSLQHANMVMGATGLALSTLSQIKSPSVLQKYLDPTRATYVSK
jgi:hypothetical protein